MRKYYFKCLNGREFREIGDFLYNRFGWEIPKGWVLYFMLPKGSSKLKYKRAYVFTGKEFLVKKLREKIIVLGLFLGSWEKESFRVSIEAGNLIGKHSKKNFYELTDEELKLWLKGENFKKRISPGIYLLKFKNYWLGGAYSNGKEIINFLPEVFEFQKKEKNKEKKRKKKVNVPKEFFNYCQKIPDCDANLLIESALNPPNRFSIRVNSLKTTPEKIFEEFPSVKFSPVPWAPNFFWIEKKDRWITKSLSFLLGEFYLQESASSLAVLVLDPRPGELILDLCAAPGSKTTQIGEMLRQSGTIVANDISWERTKILKTNIQKQGLMNAIVLNEDGRKIPLKETFDKVLVDAPCTALGTGVKSIAQWNFKTVKKLSDLQKQLIVAGFEMLKSGGRLIYSTCTITKEENEEVVQFLLKKYPGKISLEEIEPKDIKFVPGLIKGTVRIYPYFNRTESFFVASFIKK